METILNNIILILIMNGSVMIIPGVNFLLVARQSVLNGAYSGFLCASGITTAIVCHALLAALSVSILITRYPFVFSGIRYLGAAYLLYLGATFIKKAIKDISSDSLLETTESEGGAFRSGFFVDLFNPFISIFYMSLFSTMNLSKNSFLELSCYITTIFIISISWFSLVSLFFNHPLIRDTLQSKSRYLQALSGLAMFYFSAKVIFEF